MKLALEKQACRTLGSNRHLPHHGCGGLPVELPLAAVAQQLWRSAADHEVTDLNRGRDGTCISMVAEYKKKLNNAKIALGPLSQGFLRHLSEHMRVTTLLS